MTAPNDALEISETNFIRADGVSKLRCIEAGCPADMLFLKFPKHLIKSQKTEEIRFTECVSETSKTLFILWFHAELIKRGSQNISETVSILFQISSKDGRKM